MYKPRATMAPVLPCPTTSVDDTGGDYREVMARTLANRQATMASALAALSINTPTLAHVAAALIEALRAGHKVLVAGNGGSAAEAQHFAAELVGRFKRERAAYACLALTADTATLTAVANDYGYPYVFARQIDALGGPGDVLVAFSTSGESENLIRAVEACRRHDMAVVAVTGSRPSRLERAADLAVRVPTADTALAQELHMAITHLLCEVVEAQLAAWDTAGAGR